MKFFERFDKVFCINLDRRKDRMDSFQSQVDKYDLGSFERISAVDGRTLDIKSLGSKLLPGELGLVLTNIKIISESVKNSYQQILILEDDCSFTDEIKNIEFYFDKLPDDWEMLYMGGNHNTHMGVEPPLVINDKVCKLHNTYSTHLVALKNSIFSDILDRLNLLIEPLDLSYVKFQKSKNVYSFYPAIAKQIVDFSDIQNKKTDYNWLIK